MARIRSLLNRIPAAQETTVANVVNDARGTGDPNASLARIRGSVEGKSSLQEKFASSVAKAGKWPKPRKNRWAAPVSFAAVTAAVLFLFISCGRGRSVRGSDFFGV